MWSLVLQSTKASVAGFPSLKSLFQLLINRIKQINTSRKCLTDNYPDYKYPKKWNYKMNKIVKQANIHCKSSSSQSPTIPNCVCATQVIFYPTKSKKWHRNHNIYKVFFRINWTGLEHEALKTDLPLLYFCWIEEMWT